jgi:hypothetical protein
LAIGSKRMRSPVAAVERAGRPGLSYEPEEYRPGNSAAANLKALART